MLEVIQEQQDLPPGEVVQQQLASAPSTALRYVEAAGDGRWHQLRVTQRGQVDEGHGIVIGRGQRHAGFAYPARSE